MKLTSKPNGMRYVAPLSLLLLAGGAQAADSGQEYGPDPELPEPQRGLLPNMTVPEQAPWGDAKPTVPDGYTITAIATDLVRTRHTQSGIATAIDDACASLATARGHRYPP